MGLVSLCFFFNFSPCFIILLLTSCGSDEHVVMVDKLQKSLKLSNKVKNTSTAVSLGEKLANVIRSDVVRVIGFIIFFPIKQ